jgi:hypothetical protein
MEGLTMRVILCRDAPIFPGPGTAAQGHQIPEPKPCDKSFSNIAGSTIYVGATIGHGCAAEQNGCTGVPRRNLDFR